MLIKGNWKNGTRNGNGTLTDNKQNKVSEGLWTDDKFMSRHLNPLVDYKKKGKDNFFDNQPFQFIEPSNHSNDETILYSNGDKYVGPLENGTRNGYGTYYYKNGQKYTGIQFCFI